MLMLSKSSVGAGAVINKFSLMDHEGSEIEEMFITFRLSFRIKKEGWREDHPLLQLLDYSPGDR